MNNEQKLLNTRETAALLHRACRTVQTWGAQWERVAQSAGDLLLPSSPANGLRRSGAILGRALYDLRDIDEFVENTVRELLGHPLQNWRNEAEDA